MRTGKMVRESTVQGGLERTVINTKTMQVWAADFDLRTQFKSNTISTQNKFITQDNKHRQKVGLFCLIFK